MELIKLIKKTRSLSLLLRQIYTL